MGEGETYEELLASLDKYPQEKMVFSWLMCVAHICGLIDPLVEQAVYGAEDKSFKYIVEGFGRKYKNAERIQRMKYFANLPLKGTALFAGVAATAALL